MNKLVQFAAVANGIAERGTAEEQLGRENKSRSTSFLLSQASTKAPSPERSEL